MDTTSPLNLSTQFPTKVGELKSKLDNWLEGVDASLPYDIRTPVQLTWQGDQRGNIPNGWRSQQDVQEYNREVWLAQVGNGPAQLAATRFQQSLPTTAFRFDGTNGFSHQYFNVSDAKTTGSIDSDHSATFQCGFDSIP